MYERLLAASLFFGRHDDQQLPHLLLVERRCSSISRALVFSWHRPEPAIGQLHGAPDESLLSEASLSSGAEVPFLICY